MRQIKFRGKSKRTGDMVFGDLMTNYIHHKGLTIVEGGCVYHEVYPETVGQLTGMKDKAGKDIYEGDIVVFDEDEKKLVVSVENGACVLKYKDKIHVYNINPNAITIIGNIHENPELLKG